MKLQRIYRNAYIVEDDMTGRELIEWIKDNKAENYEVRVQYRDSGGYYTGTDNAEPELCKERLNGNEKLMIVL